MWLFKGYQIELPPFFMSEELSISEVKATEQRRQICSLHYFIPTLCDRRQKTVDETKTERAVKKCIKAPEKRHNPSTLICFFFALFHLFLQVMHCWHVYFWNELHETENITCITEKLLNLKATKDVISHSNLIWFKLLTQILYSS